MEAKVKPEPIYYEPEYDYEPYIEPEPLTNDQMVIDEIMQSVDIWIEYEWELSKKKPYDSFSRFINLSDEQLKSMGSEKVRDNIFRYFEIDTRTMKRVQGKDSVKYYTTYKMFQKLGWIK